MMETCPRCWQAWTFGATYCERCGLPRGATIRLRRAVFIHVTLILGLGYAAGFATARLLGW
jgi:hypothetical protein